MVARAGTPAPVVKRLSDAIQVALTDADAIARLEKMGAQLTPMPSGKFDELLASEAQRWAKVIKERNIKADG